MFVKKSGDGNYYVYKRRINKTGPIKSIYDATNIFNVRDKGACGEIGGTSRITLPKETIGKKIILKVLFVEG